MPAGTYETANKEFRIEVETDGSGKTTYTFYRPDTETMGIEYPLKLFGTGDAAYLRGYIGKMKKNDVYLVVTKGPYEGFLLTGFEVTYNDLDNKQTTASSSPTVTIPAGTRFTNYSLDYADPNGKIRVVNPGDDEGTRYDRLSIALHSAKDGAAIYLEDDIKVGFMAILPDDVGNVTIYGQGHKITRDTVVNPNTILMDPEIGENDPIMSILMNPGINLTALNDGSEESAGEHYAGSILQIGSGNEVTLKDLTIDGEGNWEIDKEKLEYDKQLNKDYDINILDAPDGGHPIKELDGNVVSTDSLIKVIGSGYSYSSNTRDYTILTLDHVTLENFFAGDGYDDDRHFIDFMSSEGSTLKIISDTVFKHNASRSGVCIGNTDRDEIDLNGCTTMEDNYCYGGNGGLIVAMEGTQVYMEDGTRIVGNVAADTNGVFIQLHKRDDGVKDGDNKGDIYSKFYMNGGEISDNIGLRGGSYGWGQTVYLYNGGSFTMDGGKICNNIGAGISSIYQQPSADALMLNAGEISSNTCSLRDIGWALDISLMNIGTVGEDMTVAQNFVVGAAAILGGYASGDEYLTNNGLIDGNISVYSYFNNEGKTTTVENNNIIDGNIRLENGSRVINNADGTITGSVTVRGSLTESAGESSFHNEGRIMGDVTLAEGAHLYNNGEIFGDVTVKAGATLEMDSLDDDGTENEKLGGTIHGNVTLYPDSVIYADVSGTYVDGSIFLEYETEEDLARMLGVIEAKGIQCASIIPKQHVHTTEYDVTETVPEDSYKCTEPWIKSYACQTCGKVVKTEETEPTGHDMYLYSTDEATCTTGKIEHYRCRNCTAFNSTYSEVKYSVPEEGPLGHHYVENTKIRIPATAYANGHEYYICTRCGDLLEIDIPMTTSGNTTHSFQNADGSLNKDMGKVTKEPTCTEEGEMTFTCEDEDCGVEIKLAIPATGHTYPADPDDYKVKEEVASTCQSPGYKTYVRVCTVCGYEDTESLVRVNLPMLPHNWSEWANVDEGIEYSCTTERKQERHCTNEIWNSYYKEMRPCGETQERLGGIKGHTFEDGVCTVCGFVKDGHTINYMTNGGDAPDSLIKAAGTMYKPGTKATLWQPTDGWTKLVPGGQAIFMGWSTTNHGTDPVEEAVDDLVTEVTIPENSSPTVFAVWAMDRNNNGKPDYAEATTVSIVYDINGGTGTVPEALTGLLPGVAYPIETAPGLTKGNVIFAGWTTDVTLKDNVISNMSDEVVKSLVISPYTVPEKASGEITLYAVYATDADADGTPDFCESALHVEYYINGGEINDGYTVDENGMFYICNDYHMPGDNDTLLKVEYGAAMIHRDKAVLIGWTAGEHKALVTSKEEIGGLTITVVSLTGASANAKVYACWAADENSNNIPDYEEKTLNHTYHRNQFLSQNNNTTLKNPGEHLKIEINEPNFVTGILPGTGVPLESNTYFGGADLVDKNGEPTGKHYIQVGWSRISHGECKSETDYDNWVIAGDADGYTGPDGKYYRTIVDERYQDAYAVWAIDNNHNDIPDFREGQWKVTLELNGGTGGADFTAENSVNKGDTFTFPADPTKEGYEFLGWSTEGDENLYKAGNTVTVNANVTYTAQYEEIITPHTVTLDINGGTPGGDFAEKNFVNDGESFTFPADPTKEGYTFLGWSTEGDENLYKAGDTVTINADVTYTAQYEPITATLSYDANGGTGNVPADKTYNKGEKVTLESGNGLRRENAVFLGWSLTKHGIIKTQAEEDSVTIITEIASIEADTTVYAVWAIDEKGGPGKNPDPGKPVDPGTNPPNPNDVPDYKQATLTYDANGGTGDVPADKTYNKGAKVTLESGEGIKRENAVFLGWSLTKHEGIIQSQAEEDAAGIVNTVTVNADTTVYAVWAVDEKGGPGKNPDPGKPVDPGTNPPNPNDVPDYKQATLTYDANGGTGDVPADKTYNKGETVTLESGNGLKRDNAVFLGWSLTKHEGIIQSQAEEDSVTIITEIESLDADTTVYAVWAVDEKGGPGKNPDPGKPVEPGTNPPNPNDVPDYKQATLTYDANGGTGDVPADKTYNKGEKVTLAGGNGLKRENAVFLGWSLTKHESIIQSQAEEDSVTIITEIASIEADTTVYAVWAIDEKGGPGKNPDPDKPVEPGTNPPNPNDVPDYKQATLTYDANGGTGDVPTDKTYNKGAKVTLESGEGIKRENAVFLGWSLTKHESIIQSQAEEDSVTIITEIESLDADTTVYAVWATDENGNGTPDYKETEPTPSDTVKLHYDANGGTGNVPADKTYNKGERVTLESGEGIKRENTVFLGWSLTKHGIIKTQAEEDAAGIVETVTVNADTTVYAVWAVDEKGGPGKNPDPDKPVEPGTNPPNPNDVPDYKQATLSYDANGGTGNVPADKTYNKGEKVTLESGNGLKRENAVFLGWSLTKHEGIIQSQAEENSVTIITEIESIEADTTVYAVWAIDENGNGTPDYKETEPTPSDTVKLHYDANGGTGNVPADKTYNKGERVTLAGGEGIKRENAVFLGWSLTKHGLIQSQAEEDAAGIVDTVTVNADTTVYAVWAIDEKGGPGKNPDPEKPVEPGTNPPNPNDVPDYKQATLTYDANGGTGDVPTDKTYNKGAKVTLESGEGIKRENAVFLGWSLTKHEGIIQSQEEENSVTIITEIESLDADTTVYAVWAVDRNGNGTPDYKETEPTPSGTVKLHYDANGGTGNVPTDKTYNKGEKVTLESGNGLKRENAVFLGWSLEKHEGIIQSQAEEDSVTIITEIASIEADTTVYAVWAVDEKGGPGKNPDPGKPVDPGTNPPNPNDVPDYKQATLTYDANGGTGNVPADKTYNKGEKVTLESGNGLKRENAVFLGWSLTKHESIIQSQAEEDAAGIVDTVTVNADTTVYAVWAVDENGNGTPDYREPNPDPYTPPSTLNTEDHFAYIVGYGTDYVRPDGDITRAEIATILFRLLKDETREKYMATENIFPDVKDTDWFAVAVNTMANMGIVFGDKSGFRPNDPITRAEMAAMVSRFFDYSADTAFEGSYSDVKEDDWFAGFVHMVSRIGIMQGNGDDTFSPLDHLTRAQAMAVMNRLLGRKVDKRGFLEGMLTWADNADENAWYYADVQEATNSHNCEEVTENGVTYERWIELTENREWTAFEHGIGT